MFTPQPPSNPAANALRFSGEWKYGCRSSNAPAKTIAAPHIDCDAKMLRLGTTGRASGEDMSPLKR